MSKPPYNPLDKLNLARSVADALLSLAPVPLADTENIAGAGVYVIYYIGAFSPYATIAAQNRNNAFKQPIYAGKAIPKGARKGGLGKNAATGTALRDRLRQHAQSIDQANNLHLNDFLFRSLVVDDIWIPLGESMMIEEFKPIWNRAIDGFGNKDPGRRRATQYKSPWDVLHPGRDFAVKLADSEITPEFLERRVADYLAGLPLAKLPKAVIEQQAAELAEAEESADEA